MQIKFGANAISVVAPAKLNLFLEVLGKRSDGYHELETLMCPISLCDELEFRFLDDPRIHLHLELPHAIGTNDDPAWQIPADDRNLVVRSVKSVRAALGATGGCTIHLKKTIPAAAGLGGGSSDAAAAIVASMLAWGKWDRNLATRIANSLGSDIGFFLGDTLQVGMALATGRGEKCENLPEQPELDFLVTHPPVGCATGAVYANVRIADSRRGAEAIIAACRTGEREQVGSLLFNSLQLSARMMTPWIDTQLDVLRAAGCRYTCLSGSGSSCFALVVDARKITEIRRAALAAGLTRAYAVKSWYSSSVEEQIQRSGWFR